VIGAVTLLFATTGVLIGSAAGVLAGRRAQPLGGAMLIGIAAKILVEHLHFGG
jgi:putative Mn2+ efflux pump MntP